MKHWGKALFVLFLTLGGLIGGPPAEAISTCINIPNVTAGTADCTLDGLTFSHFAVSASAGFSSAIVGIGPNSVVSPGGVNLLFQVASTPTLGPGDILLSYQVAASPGVQLTGINLTNDAITGPVTIGEIACRVPFVMGTTCLPADRLASITASGPGQVAGTFASPVTTAFLFKDIMVGQGGFISDFSNSHETAPAPTPEPATLLLLGTSMAGLGALLRKRRAS